MKAHKNSFFNVILDELLIYFEDIKDVSEVPDTNGEVMTILESKPGVSYITLSDSDDIIAPSPQKRPQQTKFHLKLYHTSGKY